MPASGFVSWRQRYFVTLCALTGVLLAAPLLIRLMFFLPEDIAETLRLSLNATGENNVAAWWAGALLFIGGMHAFDGYQRHVSRGAVSLGRAWLILCAILIGLSLDEIGSLHERVGSFRRYVPFAIVLVAAMGWALWRLWNDPAERKSARTMLIACALLATVPVQEYFEHTITWTPGWQYRLRSGVEEGTELLAMLIFIKAAMRNSGGVFAGVGAGAATRPVFCAPYSMPGWFPLAIAIVIPVFGGVTASLPDQWRGHPADWLASMLFLLAALACWRDLLSGTSQRYFGRIGVGLLLLVASAASVQVDPLWLGEVSGLTLNVRLSLLAVLLLGVAAFVGLRGSGSGLYTTYGWLFAAYFSAAVALVSDTLLAVYLLTPIVALFTYSLAVPSVIAATDRVLPRFAGSGDPLDLVDQERR